MLPQVGQAILDSSPMSQVKQKMGNSKAFHTATSPSDNYVGYGA